MRGTRKCRARVVFSDGIIPAYAGNTSSSCTYLPSYGDHPRVCGEHTIQAVLRGVRMGSSPRMRGTLHIITVRQDRCGIIPAYAGNTYRSAGSLPWPWDHPRVCGEHTSAPTMAKCAEGSSPRMRGTPRRNGEMRHAGGIIPAYAGNTCCPSFLLQLRWDHPRVCGEHALLEPFDAAFAGSSPRMRGTLRCCRRRCRGRGIIPAYAGNTFFLAVLVEPMRDHPRVCGEHPADTGFGMQCKGSSPRMRGTHREHYGRFRQRGIIPAYAGNT